VYFKRINFPFDQRAALLVCGIGLTAQMRREWTGEGSREGMNSNDFAESDRGSPVVRETAYCAREQAINRQRIVKAGKTPRIFVFVARLNPPAVSVLSPGRNYF